MNENKLYFMSDYMEGARPEILRRLVETNLEKSPGYGTDAYSEAAREKIRAAVGVNDADVYFLVGGTQANATVIDAMLASWQGVVAARTGHINVHEAGAVEFSGHKVIELEQQNGKLSAQTVKKYLDAYFGDMNRDHVVMPGLVYISQPTELGTLYSLKELKALSRVCRKAGVRLYLDGARLAYALACPENDVTLKDIARLCDAFYIGGTKCGALFGEAVVFPKKGSVPHFFTIVKQHGALLAKGRIAALQFDALFTDGLYETVGKNAIDAANRIRKALVEKGYRFAIDTPTNQIFVVLDEETDARLSEGAELDFWEKLEDGRVIKRIATSWATTEEDVERLIGML